VSAEEEAKKWVKPGAVRFYLTGLDPVTLDAEMILANLQLDEAGEHTVQINFYTKHGDRLGFVEFPKDEFTKVCESALGTLESVRKRAAQETERKKQESSLD